MLTRLIKNNSRVFQSLYQTKFNNNLFSLLKTTPFNSGSTYSFVTLHPKPLDFASSEENILYQQNLKTWKTDYSTVISKYPFHHIPLGIIRNNSLIEAEQSLKNDLIAFKLLTVREIKDLQTAYKLIIPQNIRQSSKFQINNGQQLFNLYFQNRINSLIMQINNNQGTLLERTKYFIILNNISERVLKKHQQKEINEKNLVKQDITGVLTAYYIQYLTKQRKDTSHLFPFVYQKLQSQSNSAENKLNIAKAIITTYRFMDNYPQKMLSLALDAFTNQISKLHNYEILYSMRLIYNYRSQSAKRYAEAIMNFIINEHLTQHNIDFHVPLILKAIKYCNLQRLSCKQLLQFITKNMSRFKIIFQKKNISKGLLFSLIFQTGDYRDINDQVVKYLRQYFMDTIKQFSQAEEVEQVEIIRCSKLLIKYFQKLTEEQKKYIKQKYIQHIIPHFNHSNQILCFSLLVVLREKTIRPQINSQIINYQREQLLIKKSIVQYLKSIAIQTKDGLVIDQHINSAIEIMYQVARHELQFKPKELPSLINYDFTRKNSLEPETVSYFFTYLSKNTLEKKDDIRKALVQLQPLLQIFLRKKKIRSIKTIYSILNVCDNVSFEHNFFYKLIENAISDFITSNPDFFIQERDIKFINDKLLKRGYGSQNLKKFIVGVLDQPKNWPKLRKQYCEHEIAFKQKMQSKRREKKFSR